MEPCLVSSKITFANQGFDANFMDGTNTDDGFFSGGMCFEQMRFSFKRQVGAPRNPSEDCAGETPLNYGQTRCFQDLAQWKMMKMRAALLLPANLPVEFETTGQFHPSHRLCFNFLDLKVDPMDLSEIPREISWSFIGEKSAVAL